MVTAIVFSKDRPLQLEAWLESLFHHVGIAPDAVIALVREVGGIRYDALRARWPQVHWISETDFAKDLSEAVRVADPFILWGCDDVVFKGPVDLSLALHRLARDPEAAAFSLRLGRSIAPCPADLKERDGVLEWDWRSAREPHWNYPWEVSGSIYRKSDVERLLAGSPPARSPNFLEGDLATRLESDPTLLPPRLLSFTQTKCLTVTVNRVQETHPNHFDGSASTDVDTLWRLHREGRRMDWRSLEGRANGVIHVDASWFALESPTTPSRVEVAPTGPLASILCFVYNRERYVEETIRSVLDQKGANIELVLLDDGSTDRTPELLRPFLDDPRVRHVRQDNVGHDGSFHRLNNRCVELARGDFLSFVGADDIFDPHKTARQLEVFRDDPGLDVLFADGRHIDAAGRSISSDFRRPESVGLTPLNLLRNLFRSNFIAHPTVMMRRSSYLRGGWFENGFAADYHFWLKTALTHRYRYLDEKLLSYRVHAEGSSTGTDNPSHREALKVRGLARGMFGPDDFYPELLVAPDRKAALAEAFLDLGNRSLAVYTDLALAAADYERSLERADSPVTRHNLAMVHLAAGRTQEGRRLLDGVAAGSGDAAEAARNFLSGQGQGKILGLPSDGFLARALPILEQRAMQGRPAPTGAPEPAAFAGGIPCSPRNSTPVVPRLETILARVEELVGRQDLDGASVLLRDACSLPGASPALRKMADNLEQAAHARRRTASRESVSRVLSEADGILASGDPDGALRALEGLASEQETVEIVNARAWLQVQAGRLAQAQVEYLKAAQLWPDDPDVHANLAGIRLRMGRQEQAESSLRRVLALRPQDPEALLALARLRGAMGDSDEARDLYDIFRRVAPNHQGVAEAVVALARPGMEKEPPSDRLDVTIVIPVKDQLPLLTKCLDSLEGTLGGHRVEIVVVDDHSMDDTAQALASWEKAGRVRLLKAPVAGNFAASCNSGARDARANTLVFLNSDTEARPGWLGALLAMLEDPGVGAVGARLLFPDETVQHAGIAFRPDGNPYHPNRGLDGGSPLVTKRRDMPGLTGACLAMRAELFSSLGGFDTGYRFQVEDLDLCLRIWAKGLRVVYEPASCLLHHEGGSSVDRPEKERIYGEGLSRLFNSWADRGGFPPAVQALPGFPAMLKSGGAGESSPTPHPFGGKKPAGAWASPPTTSLSGIPSGDPKVSVIVPTCDRPVFLRRALESLTTQTWRDFEVVVVDDAGCDVSRIVEEFLHKGLSIRLVVQPQRRGLGAARNAGIASVRAPWIAYLDDDDLYYPDHLRLLLETLERSGAQVAYSDSMRAVEEEQDGQWVVLSNELAMSNEFDREGFLRSNLTPVNNVVHARSCWQQVGGIDESLPVLEDWDFWIRLSRRWDFVHVPVATTEIRWRSNGANMTFQRQNLFQPTRERIERKVAAMLKAEETGRTRVPFAPDVPGQGLPSVAWCGPLFNHTGYARQSREAVTALVNLGANVSVDPQQNDLNWFEGLRSDAAAMAHWKRVLSAPAGGDVLVCCDIPSDSKGAHDVFAEMATGHPESRSRVAWTMFETDRAPAGWAEKLNRMDQVWVPSRQVHAAFLASGVDSSRLRIVPDGLDPVAYANARPYALPGPVKGTTFLSVFQWSRRKGYDVLLSAWAQAFRPSDDVRLVLRCHAAGGVSARAQLDSWLSRSGHSLERMAPVILIEDFIPEPEMPGLYAACDVFVLPTRGEGWGLPFLESMASGKPSIATAWGGQTDFLHEGVAWMLPASGLVPVDAEALRENPFLTSEHRWADPQVADLVSALHAAHGSADERRRKGTRARAEFLARWTSAHTAQTISASLRELPGQDAVVQPRHGTIGGSRLSGVLANLASGLRRDPKGHAASQVAVGAPSRSPSSQNLSQAAGLRSTAPMVSVILPTRDRPVFLRRALESLETQTFRDFEVVVVDDAGCDVSAIAAEFLGRGLSLRLEVHPERRGLGAARNTGIRAARGPWIAYLDDDDLYYPDHLRLILDALDRTGAKVAYSDSMRAVEEERDGQWVVLSNELAMSNDFDRDAFLRTNLTPVNNVIHARTCWDLVGGIDESLPVLEDWDFWIRLSRRWDFVHVPVATTEIRWRSNGANMTFQRQREFQPTRDRIAAKVAQMLRLEGFEREGVSMVILVRDCLEVTKDCLASLELHTPEPHEIILVDNGSNAETAAWLRDWVAARPHSVLVRNDDNRGFAGGNNQGLALAKGRFLLLLNNDTVLTPGWLERMLAVLSRHPECGAVGPVSNRVSGPQLDATATYADASGLILHARDRAQRFQGRSDEILRAVGFCLLFRREVFDAVGGLDERFGKGNFEDDDFSLRVRHAGWTSRMALDSFVHHVGGATFRGENIDYTKSLLTNWAIFLRKWGLPEDLPYERGYPLQESPPTSALSRIETPTPLRDHKLVQARLYLPASTDAATGSIREPSSPTPTMSSTQESATAAEDVLESLSSILFQVESAVAMQDSLQAEALSKEAVELHPDQPLAWLSRAMVLRGAGKSGKALEALTKSASLGGGAEVIYETMALHLQEGRNAPALVQWNLLRTKHPQWVKERKAMHQKQGLPWLPDRFIKAGKSPKKPAGKKR